MRWTYQNLKWGVLPSSFCCQILLTGGKRSPPSIWISWSVTEPAQLILPVSHRCVRCGGCRSPSVSRRCCCPCHLLLRAKRGAVARWGRRTAPKDSASSMCLIRRYQVGEASRLSHAPWCARVHVPRVAIRVKCDSLWLQKSVTTWCVWDYYIMIIIVIIIIIIISSSSCCWWWWCNYDKILNSFPKVSGSEFVITCYKSREIAS